MADQGSTSTGMAVDPQGGAVYDNTVTYPNYAKNTWQSQKVDPSGASIANNEGRLPTYSAGTVAYSPYTAASDILSIAGSATKLVRVKRIGVSGRANAANQIDVCLIRRTTADSGASQTTLTAVSHDSSYNPSATAAVLTFGTAQSQAAGTVFRAQQGNLSASGSGGAAVPVEWHFGDTNDQAIVLHGVNDIVAVNLNGAAVPAGTVLNLFVEWTEE